MTCDYTSRHYSHLLTFSSSLGRKNFQGKKPHTKTLCLKVLDQIMPTKSWIGSFASCEASNTISIDLEKDKDVTPISVSKSFSTPQGNFFLTYSQSSPVSESELSSQYRTTSVIPDSRSVFLPYLYELLVIFTVSPLHCSPTHCFFRQAGNVQASRELGIDFLSHRKKPLLLPPITVLGFCSPPN